MDWVIFGQQCVYGMTVGASYALFALGLTLIFGVLRVINLAHGEFYMLGALITSALMMYLGVGFFLSALLSVALVAVVALICNRLAVQPLVIRSPLSVLLSTIALSLILVNASVTIWGTEPKKIISPISGIIQLGDICIPGENVVALVIGAIVIAVVYFFLTRTTMGKVVQCTAQNMLGARLIGVNIKRVYDFTFVIASVLAAVAGILLAPIWFAHPFMGQLMLIKGFCIVIVGGMGNVKGCIVFGLLLGIAEALFGQYVSTYYRDAFAYGIMIVVLLVKPEGLFSRV